MDGASTTGSVIAIIVTYRRVRLACATVQRVLDQTVTPASVVVVDNDDCEELKLRLAPETRVQYVGSSQNLGPGGGFALGLQTAGKFGPTSWYWLLDDDSPPALNSLELALDTAHSWHGNVGVVSTRGGRVRHGRIRHDYRAGVVSEPVKADFALVDGSVIKAEAVRRAGYPRSDFFIMMEDLEYTMRIAAAGFDVVIRPSDGSTNLYQGSGAPWRGYYQSRNHLRLAIERRSPAWVAGWAIRELGILCVHVRHWRIDAIRYRARGAVDGVRGRMGVLVHPS